jgi:cephalosporin hydroxylase
MNLAKVAEALYKRELRRLRRFHQLSRIGYRPRSRQWGSALGLNAAWSIQHGALQYQYRGQPMLKNPFDVALYQMLVWQLKPRTIVEIGSYLGTSALWLAEMQTLFGIDGQVLSLDIEPPQPPFHRANLRFLQADANRLAESPLPALLASAPRPFLVIEDSSHLSETTLAVLRFFDNYLQSDEYIVIEDGLVTDLGVAHKYARGPGAAISQFLAETKGRYEIDAAYCDRYGHNFTGNPNGYLRRLTATGDP